MHLALPPDRADEAIRAGWAEPHPIARMIGQDGLVLVYTPRDFDAYCYITGLPRPSIATVA
jgi:hypothetical protein